MPRLTSIDEERERPNGGRRRREADLRVKREIKSVRPLTPKTGLIVSTDGWELMMSMDGVSPDYLM